MKQGISINRTQAALTIASTGIAFGIITKFALNKSTLVSSIVGIIGLGVGFIIDTQLQK
jgi:hypothetical protein